MDINGSYAFFDGVHRYRDLQPNQILKFFPIPNAKVSSPSRAIAKLKKKLKYVTIHGVDLIKPTSVSLAGVDNWTYLWNGGLALVLATLVSLEWKNDL